MSSPSIELRTQQFLRRHGLAALIDAYKFKARRHGEFPNLVHLKYNQIESPLNEPAVQECRALILDEAADWAVVAFPFRKFFNAGEPLAADIDWSTACVQEKLDGSMMVLYPYAGRWLVSSSGFPDAAGAVRTIGGTFAELFWRTWKDNGLQLPPIGDTSPRCYMFELMTPFNRVVVPHQPSRLVLIGARDLSTLQEIPADTSAAEFGWPAAASLPLTSFDDCMKAAAALDPIDAEGFVVVDGAFNRVKIKSPRYVAIAHAIESCSPRRLLELVRSNESAEFLAYFPELKKAYDDVAASFAAVSNDVDRHYTELTSIASQKEFAAAALKTRFSAALFALRAGKHKSGRAFFATCTPQLLERAMGIEAAE